jgi:hypothetical protein
MEALGHQMNRKFAGPVDVTSFFENYLSIPDPELQSMANFDDHSKTKMQIDMYDPHGAFSAFN